MTYHLKMQIANLSSNGEVNSMLLYPNFTKPTDTIRKALGYSLCNDVANHYYFIWFKDLYGHGEVITTGKITTIYDIWCLARIRNANPIEEFDFKYHTELSDLLEDGSIGLLFELGKKKDEQSKMG